MADTETVEPRKAPPAKPLKTGRVTQTPGSPESADAIGNAFSNLGGLIAGKAPPPAVPSYRYPTFPIGGDVLQSAFYPGIPRVDSMTYTVVHGITPGTIQIVTYSEEDDIDPAPYGNLIVTDGQRTVTIRGCKLDRFDSVADGAGYTHTIHLLDRRWKWRNQWGGLGGTSGRFNRLDDRGALVPWSIRSPEELCKWCLRAMGETNYRIDLPNGIRKAAGADLDRYLRLGEHFPRTDTNPAVSWDHTPPAEALNQVADYFGARVVYQPVSDRVLIVPQGSGISALPDWPFESIAPSVDLPETPSGVGAYGAPVRIQYSFLLEPVGEEWDGSVVPIDDLSYAPDASPTTNGSAFVKWTGTGDPYPAIITVKWGGKSVELGYTEGDVTAAAVFTAMKAYGEANADTNADLQFSFSGTTFTATARRPGFPVTFSVQVFSKYSRTPNEPPPVTVDPLAPDFNTAWQTGVTASGAIGFGSWERCIPPQFLSVKATDRLSHLEAEGLARGSVWKWYRVVNVDYRTGTAPIVLPGFGPVKRLAQLTIQPSKVEQVVPSARIPGGANKGNKVDPSDIAGILPEFYNGRSRDQAATVTGGIDMRLGQVMWFRSEAFKTGNTLDTDRVFVPFSVETDARGNQLVKFSEHVFRKTEAGFLEKPKLLLETACLVTDPETDQVVRYEAVLSIPGGTAPVEWHSHPDLQVGIIGPKSKAGKTDAQIVPTTGTIGVTEVSATNTSGYPLHLLVTATVNGEDLSFDLSSWTYPIGGGSAGRLDAVVANANANPDFAANFTVSRNGLALSIVGKSAFPFAVAAVPAWDAGAGPDPGVAGSYTSAVVAGGVAPPGPAKTTEPAPKTGATPPDKSGFKVTERAPNADYTFAEGDIEYTSQAALTYLLGHAKKYVVVGGDARNYIGIYPIDPDGSVQHVTWSIGDGPSTLASLNTERSPVVPPYPARRRNELLTPNKLAAEANRKEDERLFPKTGSAVR